MITRSTVAVGRTSSSKPSRLLSVECYRVMGAGVGINPTDDTALRFLHACQTFLWGGSVAGSWWGGQNSEEASLSQVPNEVTPPATRSLLWMRGGRSRQVGLKTPRVVGQRICRSGPVLLAGSIFAANLSGARLWFADLYGARLHHANFTDTDLSGTHFSHAEAQGRSRSVGPLQEQLDAARAEPDIPPRLDDLTDPETGEPLVWRGEPLEDRA